VGRRLSDRQSPEVVEGEEEAVLRLESAEGTPERPMLELPLERAVVGRLGHDVELEDAAPTPGHPQCRPDDVAAKPGPECRRLPETVETAPRGEQRVLDGVGRVGVRSGDDLRHAEGRRQGRLDERAERVAVAGPGRLDQVDPTTGRVQCCLHVHECVAALDRFNLPVIV
jgi:hypothetical protein